MGQGQGKRWRCEKGNLGCSNWRLCLCVRQCFSTERRTGASERRAPDRDLCCGRFRGRKAETLLRIGSWSSARYHLKLQLLLYSHHSLLLHSTIILRCLLPLLCSARSSLSMAPPTHLFSPLPPGQDNAAQITNLFKQGGPGTTVLLQQSKTYVLHTTIDFTHPDTTLATEGFPAFESGRQAVLETRGEKEAGAVNLFNKSGTAMKRVHVRGCRGWGRHRPSKEDEEEMRRNGTGLGWVEGGGAVSPGPAC